MATALLDKQATLQRAVKTPDGRGSYNITSWDDIFVDVACRFGFSHPGRMPDRYSTDTSDTPTAMWLEPNQSPVVGSGITDPASVDEILMNTRDVWRVVTNDHNGTERYFEIVGSGDMQRRGRIMRIELLERDRGYKRWEST